MDSSFFIRRIDHRSRAVAQQLHDVRMSAYAQEAELLQAVHFPPLNSTVADIQGSSNEILSAAVGEVMAGAIAIHREEGSGVHITSLVVAPRFQRRGIGRALLAAALVAHDGQAFTVQTGARNAPALALYRELGFLEIRRWLAGPEPLELVELRRAAAAQAA